ncbi:MAG: hypothetical protein IJA95_07505 [Bacteroidaceae bacterium]|nr:hypothetical protein [Bacteroidaceae bacterium]
MIGKTNALAGMSKGETVSILLKTNQSSNEDLNGVKVVVSYNDESHEYVYNGQFSVQILNGKVYTVSFGEVNGYKTPSSVTYTAVKGFSRSVEVAYSSEFLTLNVTGTSTPVVTIRKAKEVGVSEKYKVVDYVETDGTQYIDTGFKPNNNTRVVMDMQAFEVNANGWAFGGRNSTSTNSMGVFYYYSSNKLWNADYSGSSQRKSFSGIGATDRIVIDFNKNICSINGVSNTFTATTFQSSYSMVLFAVNTANTVSTFIKAKLYSCKIYDNDILVRDYIPALRSDGVAGLYDAVNDTFSSSTGSLVSGGYIYDETISTQTSVSGLHKIAYDTEYMIEASAVDGYTTPESQTYTASQPTREISMEYTKVGEHVVVDVIDGDNDEVYDQVLTVSGDITGSYTITGDPIEFDVPEGLTYTVSVNDKDGYITPESQTFTAGTGTREIYMVYFRALGVFIQGVSGKLYKTDDWTNQETPNGVAVITEECSFVVALTEASEMRISGIDTIALENYMTAISNSTEAKSDYQGALNTANIMKLKSGTDYAAGWCNAFWFPSGKNGFLPSLGQMYAAYINKSAVDAALTKAGGTELDESYYWTSTFNGVRNADNRSCWRLDWGDGSVVGSSLNMTSRVRAFSDL